MTAQTTPTTNDLLISNGRLVTWGIAMKLCLAAGCCCETAVSPTWAIPPTYAPNIPTPTK